MHTQKKQNLREENSSIFIISVFASPSSFVSKGVYFLLSWAWKNGAQCHFTLYAYRARNGDCTPMDMWEFVLVHLKCKIKSVKIMQIPVL